jgi:hypothetical protein
MHVLFYRRPPLIPKSDQPLSFSECQKYVERAAASEGSIPTELSFERILNRDTRPVSANVVDGRCELGC